MKISVIFPHPDDGALYAAGTLTRWVAEGHDVTAICCTRGDMGTLRKDQSRQKLGRIRSAELLAANKILGIERTEFLEFPDGCSMDPEALREALVRCVRKHKPDRVVTLDPWVRYEVHRDHTLVGQMASEATVFSCFPLFYPQHIEEGLNPHNATEIWYMGLLGKAPNTFVSIHDQLDTKTEALLKFEVTLDSLNNLFGAETTAGTATDQARRWIADSAGRFGAEVGLKAAEAFLVQKCAPGHFVNAAELYAEMLGVPVSPPMVIA